MEEYRTKNNAPPAPEGTPVIRCRDLVVAYGSLLAVNGLSLEILRGECFGLLGHNGAGKTTAVEVFEGLLPPRAGTVEILGERWGRSEADDRRLRQRLGVALQETHLPENLTVFEIIRLFRSFYRGGREINELIALMGLEEKKNARVGKLSSGQRQRLALACALVGAPEIIFLDEPTTGLDPHARLTIWQAIEALIRDSCTVLLTTHYMEEAARLCQRVGIIDKGRLIALDSPAGLVRTLGAGEIVELKVEGEFPLESVRRVPGVHRVEKREQQWILMVNDSTRTLPGILSTLSVQGMRVDSVSTHQATLEDVFVRLTGKGLGDE
ncbi:MAG: ABC transporter ATP-binding protein [Proteobacteria bacterium]|nr:ABC transporter ATP-binding protein [Pseudomonadota bacterium]